MQNRTKSRLAALIALLTASLVPAGGNASAEDLAGDWTVVAIAQDPCGKYNPLRNGYYDWGTGNGWGYKKLALKHGLSNVQVWRDTMRFTCGSPEYSGSTTWIYEATAYLNYCSSGQCEDLDSTRLHAVIQRAQFNSEKKGTITMYCKGYTVCPQWVNDYTNLRTSARLGARLNDENSSRGETPAPKVRLEPVTLVPVEPGSIHVPEVAVAAKMNGTRGAQVLRTLQGDMRKLTYGLTPTIIEFRQPSADTVEVVYSYPGYDGLIGLRRNVAERQVDVPATDPAYQVAANENDPREIATMLRLDLEEPPPTDALRPAIDGIAWWGAR